MLRLPSLTSQVHTKQKTFNVSTRSVRSNSASSSELRLNLDGGERHNDYHEDIDNSIHKTESFAVKREVSQAFTSVSSKLGLSSFEPSYLNALVTKRDSGSASSIQSGLHLELDTHVQRVSDRLVHTCGYSLDVKKTVTIAQFQSFLNNERLRYMPGPGSKLDNIFKKADAFAKSFSTFMAALDLLEMSAQQSRNVLLSTCQIIVRHGQRFQLAVERFFSTFEKLGIMLRHMGEKADSDHGSAKSRSMLVAVLVMILETTIEICTSLDNVHRTGLETDLLASFEIKFETVLARVNEIKIEFQMETISCWLEHHDKESSKDMLLLILRGFELDSHFSSSAYLTVLINVCGALHHHGEVSECLKWYEWLWNSFKRQRLDSDITIETWLDVFQDYIALLREEAHWEDVVRVSFELREIILADHGSRHHFYIRTSLNLAKLLELDERRYKEAATIYEEICRFEIPMSGEREIFISLIEDAKHRLLLLLECHADLAHKLESIIIEAFRSVKIQFGCSHEKTLIQLTRVIEYYEKFKRRDSIASGLKILEEYIVELMIKERDELILFEVAKSLDKLYRQLSSIEVGVKFLESIRQEISKVEVWNGSTGCFTLEQRMSIDRRSFVFITVLEEMLYGRFRENMLAEVIAELFKETCLMEAYSKSIELTSLPMHLRLIAGAQLLAFMDSKCWHDEAKTIREQMWSMFQQRYFSSNSASESLRHLFELTIVDLTQSVVSFEMLEVLVDVSLDFFEKAEYETCLELVSWCRACFTQLISSSNAQIVKLGFKLAGAISIASKTKDKIRLELQRISSEILLMVLKLDTLRDIDFGSLSVIQINVIIRMLGEQKSFGMLERILQYLWDTRFTRNWSGVTTVATGRRLCEVKFAAGHQTSAIQLLENIYYNLRDVYGSLHRLTVECETLRAKFHNTCGNHWAARDIHVHLLHEIIGADSETADACDDIAALGIDQAKRLKWACHQNPEQRPKWEGYHCKLLGDLKESVSLPVDIDVNMAHEGVSADDLHEDAQWEAPSDWSLPIEFDE